MVFLWVTFLTDDPLEQVFNVVVYPRAGMLMYQIGRVAMPEACRTCVGLPNLVFELLCFGN